MWRAQLAGHRTRRLRQLQGHVGQPTVKPSVAALPRERRVRVIGESVFAVPHDQRRSRRGVREYLHHRRRTAVLASVASELSRVEDMSICVRASWHLPSDGASAWWWNLTRRPAKSGRAMHATLTPCRVTPPPDHEGSGPRQRRWRVIARAGTGVRATDRLAGRITVRSRFSVEGHRDGWSSD